MTSEIRAFIAEVSPDRRRRDALVLLGLYSRATGANPKLWGNIIGFGQYHYKYQSGRQGDAPAAAFAPRKAATSIYLADGVSSHASLLKKLGKHRTGVGCVYVTNLDLIDLGVLEEIVRSSYGVLTSGTYSQRARDGGQKER